MEKRSIDDIYSGNAGIGQKFRSSVEGLTAEAAAVSASEGTWTVAQVVEHVAMVEDGIVRICAKLLLQAKADDQRKAGAVISDEFLKNSSEIGARKLEAPERVQPLRGLNISESLGSLEVTGGKLDELRPLFEEFDADAYKFPHPYFGDLSAAEWLLLNGGHKARHLAQIRAILATPEQ